MLSKDEYFLFKAAVASPVVKLLFIARNGRIARLYDIYKYQKYDQIRLLFNVNIKIYCKLYQKVREGSAFYISNYLKANFLS